jgi:hypothetical protein
MPRNGETEETLVAGVQSIAPTFGESSVPRRTPGTSVSAVSPFQLVGADGTHTPTGKRPRAHALPGPTFTSPLSTRVTVRDESSVLVYPVCFEVPLHEREVP